MQFYGLTVFLFDTKSSLLTFQKAHLKTAQESQRAEGSNPKIPPLQSIFFIETWPQRALSQLQTLFWKKLPGAFYKWSTPAPSTALGWSRVDKDGEGWTKMEQDGAGWTRMDKDGAGWSRLEQGGAGWTRMELDG